MRRWVDFPQYIGTREWYLANGHGEFVAFVLSSPGWLWVVAIPLVIGVPLGLLL